MTADGRPDETGLVINERYFLSKFDGDSTDPQDEVERIEFNKDLQVVAIHKIENGEIVSTRIPDEES